jgi:hypothetical protein
MKERKAILAYEHNVRLDEINREYIERLEALFSEVPTFKNIDIVK